MNTKLQNLPETPEIESEGVHLKTVSAPLDQHLGRRPVRLFKGG